MLRGTGCAALLLWAAVFAAGAPVAVPSLAPQISSVFPHGARSGSTVEVSLRGTHLDRAARLEFSSRGIVPTILSSGYHLLKLRLAIDAAAESGSHEFRLFTATGSAIGVFQVGSLPEIRESEPNDRLESAQDIALPVVINGTADAADADYFRFHAGAGQTVTFDADAVRSGSALDPVLAILDAHGAQLAYCDDFYTSKDAHLEYTFAASGTYWIRLTASYERSSPGAEYRLTVTEGPYPMYAVPAGARRGQAVEVMIHGANLAGVDRAWLDTAGVRATIARRSSSGLVLRLGVPANLALGAHRLHLASGTLESAAPLRFDISDLPEITASDPRLSDRAHPLPIETPVVVNAEIAGHGADYLARQHWYEFEAREGSRYEFQVKSWELGLRADPVVALYDLHGKKLALEDDPAPNAFIHYAASHDPDLVYRFSQAGRYRLLVRDSMYRGGEGFIYRLTVRETVPAYSVDVHGPQVTAYIGRKTTVLAQVRRTGGVHVIECFKKPDTEIENFRIQELDGWKAPVIVWAEGVPPGVTAEKVSAEPRDTDFKGNDGEELFVDGTLVEVPIDVGAQAKPGLYRIRIRAESSFEGRTLERSGRVLHTMRGLRGQPVFDGDFYLSIVQPPPLLLETPAELEVSPGEATHLKVGLYRFRQTGDPVSIQASQACASLVTGQVIVPSETSETELPVRAVADASREECRLVLAARSSGPDAHALAESPPIVVKTRPRKAASQ